MTDEVQFIAKPSFLRNHADTLFVVTCPRPWYHFLC